VNAVLITGGCGFIGSNLTRYLEEKGCRVRVVDDLRTGDLANAPTSSTDVVVGDAADPEVLEAALEGIDAVVHLASQTGVQPSVEDPRTDFEGNAATTFRVLDTCRRVGVSRFVFASSGAAVGDVVPPIHEEVVPRPVSPYGAGKLAGEAYCRAFAASFGMHTVALRFSNVYGPHSAHKRNAIPNFIKRAIAGEPIVIYGDGTQTRDFIYVADLCSAIDAALVTDGIPGELFQVATGVETSVSELASLVLKTLGSDEPITFEPRRQGEVHRSSVDISKIRRLLGFSPSVTLDDGLVHTADWYREHGAGSDG
jgi:UDP-glucose 4-epimerase